jgi:hypothetical protein
MKANASRGRTGSRKRTGLLLTAALLLAVFSTSAPARPAQASDSCWSYNTTANGATHQDNGTPTLYWNDKPATPRLGLGLNTCGNYILVKWSQVCSIEGCDPSTYYKVDWWRPGLNDWKEFTVSYTELKNHYANYHFVNAHRGTYYWFAVRVCTKTCFYDWSPTVTIYT